MATGVLDQPASCQESSEASGDELVIRQAVAAYVEAFNKHNATALAGFWSPEAVYLNRVTGEEVVGRPAIAEQFVSLFKDMPEITLTVNTESIQFISPNVAVEHGTSKLISPKSEPDELDYAAVYVKRDGQWLLDRVTDAQRPSPSAHYEHLKALEWMVGQWTDNGGDDVDVEADCHWTKNQNFLVRSYAISVRDQIDMSGMQIIGWDPAANSIRSWTFDSDGTFAEAIWTQKGDRWFVSNSGVVADGRRASMVNVIKPVDNNSFTWQTVERMIGSELLPNINEIVIVRKSPAPSAGQPSAGDSDSKTP
ncbi:MAG TPA: SgcJ/EcaC family oxidoreductase [Candidatus Methylacidiphilales bacterium]|nr:SgcJ/EcaC family oxidoreductase [Candidatus Methylacidiphilales bacterium]